MARAPKAPSEAPPPGPGTPIRRERPRRRLGGGLGPLTHFLLLGAVLFCAERWLSPRSRPEVVVSADRIEQVLTDFRRDFGLEPDEEQRSGLIGREADDELLIAHALELGLHREGPSRHRLAELATFLGERGSQEELVDRALALALHRRDPEVRQRLIEAAVAAITAADEEYGPGEVPPDQELEELLREDPRIYSRPERFRLTQIFVAGEGDPALDAAGRLRERLVEDGIGPRRAERFSDPGPLPVQLGALDRRELLLRFGDAAADRVGELAPGRWSEPVPVINGAHLFWLHERLAPRQPELAEVREEVLRHWVETRREARLAVGLEDLRRRYRVRIDEPAEAEP